MSVDITLFGATGFTGRLTAVYLGTHLPDGGTWAVAGRSAEKLQSVVDEVVAAGGVAPEVVVADVSDPASMAAMARGTRVLISTVGPYVQVGDPAVKAAAEAGIAYVDLTGEPEFVDRTWLAHHQTAVRTGATLVHACGFDSIPYDLGVLYTVEQLPEGVPIDVKGYIRAGGTASGGTYHSAIGAFARLRQSASTAKERRQREPRPEGRKVRGAGKVGRGADGKGWALPLPTIDPQVVLRSARALERYGPEFTYSHFAQFTRLPVLVGTVAGAGVLLAGAQLPPTRKALLKLRAQGDGPSPEKRASSWFRLRLVGEGGGKRVVTQVSGGDPGYDETAKMLSESALCLAYDDVPKVAGQTTTAVAMGRPLIDRLDRAGIRFETLES
jgi:short subunit dehydrogenase-like uncharacterized protein